MTDIPVNPKSLVVNGAIVNATNPLTTTAAQPPQSPGTSVSLNPSSLVVNGVIVSADNPLPISVV